MMHHFLKPILRRSSPLCTSCYNNSGRTLPSKLLFSRRPFHTTKPTHVPIIPIPLFITGALKSGQLVSLVSLSSKTSLTLLPHTFRRGGKADTIAKVLAGIPVVGFTLLLVIGLDQAPNTSRLRLVYLSEEEEKEIVKAEIDALLDSQSGLVVPKDNEVVMWLQTIVNNLAAAAVDDIRLPVRHYGEETQNQESKEIQLVPTLDPVDIPIPPTEDDFRPAIPRRNFDVDVIWDSSTVNAMCAGSNIIVYNLLIQYLEYDTNRIAVILSHEIAHSLQRHFVEQRGFSSLMLMLGDITRGVFWMVTEPFGPYVNQKINEYISTFIALETETTYNRKLEKEADLVGLKILAKAGYDPKIAVEVWEMMAALEEEIKEIENEETKDGTAKIESSAVIAARKSVATGEEEENQKGVELGAFLDSLVNSWFGSTHPPSLERIEYMRENMDEAILLYNEAIKLNGAPKEFIFSQDQVEQHELEIIHWHERGILATLHHWISSVYSWSSSNDGGLVAA